MRQAQRAGLQTVLLPERNRKDLRDVPEGVRTAMQFIFLETADDAIQAALNLASIHSPKSGFKLV